MKTPRVAIYYRVSTSDQDFASQERLVRDYCDRRGWSDLTIYEEKESGAKQTRPRLAALMAAVRHNLVDAIVVYKLSRFGRSANHFGTLFAELRTRKVGFVSATEGIDTTNSVNNSTANLLAGMLALLAEFDRENIGDNTREGLAAARKAGRIGGRPRGKDKAIARALKLVAAGKLKPAEIARKCKLTKQYLSLLIRGKRKAVQS